MGVKTQGFESDSAIWITDKINQWIAQNGNIEYIDLKLTSEPKISGSGTGFIGSNSRIHAILVYREV